MKLKGFKKKKVIIGGVILVIILFIIFRITTAHNPMPPIQQAQSNNAVNVETAVVEKGTISTTTTFTGEVAPIDEVAIIPTNSGTVTNVFVSLGDYINKGTTLFSIDNSQSQISLTQAKASYDSAESSYNDAVTNFERMQELYKQGSVSKKEFEEAQLNKNNVYNTLVQAQATLDSASDTLSDNNVIAPISGYITYLDVSTGSMAGQSTSVIIADVSSVEIEGYITEYLINKITLGDKVSVLVRSASGEPFEGIVSTLSPVTTSDSPTYPIKISVDNSEGLLKAGMVAEAEIDVDTKNDVVLVPSDAVMIKNGNFVVATYNNDQLKLVPVTIGVDNGTNAEIVLGINEGDIIIVKGQHYVEEKSTINVVNGENAS